MYEDVERKLKNKEDAEKEGQLPEKKKYLFYYEEAINSWTPVVSVECMVSLDEFDNEGDEKEIKFRCFWMTDEEYNNMPID